jgi:hypothetical protein
MENIVDPSDDIIQASLAANGGQPVKAKGWKWARDRSDIVVSADLGWGRRLVFTLQDGATTPRIAVAHGLLGSRRVR